MLEVKNISKTFYGKHRSTLIVDNASFQIGKNEVIGIVGKSGSGKSTIARMITGTIAIDSGSIYFNNENVTAKGEKYNPAMRRKIQIVGQQPFLSLDPRQKAGAAIIEPMLYHGITDRSKGMDEVKSLLKSVWLEEDVIDKYPHQLSGGMCQRVSLARAIGLRPELLIADESTSMLDTAAQSQIIRLLEKLRKERGLAILFISHDLDLVNLFSNQVLCLEEGNLRAL